jgi:hypothetical protein
MYPKRRPQNRSTPYVSFLVPRPPHHPSLNVRSQASASLRTNPRPHPLSLYVSFYMPHPPDSTLRPSPRPTQIAISRLLTRRRITERTKTNRRAEASPDISGLTNQLWDGQGAGIEDGRVGVKGRLGMGRMAPREPTRDLTKPFTP